MLFKPKDVFKQHWPPLTEFVFLGELPQKQKQLCVFSKSYMETEYTVQLIIFFNVLIQHINII